MCPPISFAPARRAGSATRPTALNIPLTCSLSLSLSLWPDKPNLDGAGTTGGIIGGLIAAIVALAVVATGILICRQQQKNRMEREDDE